MRITLLANPDNLHVRRWIEFLAGRGHELTLLTDPFTRARPSECAVMVPRWNLASKILAFRLTPRPFGNDRWKHLHYRPLVRASRPDVVHGFEAFNYGLATALSGPYPKVLTPWGNDVFAIADASPLAGRMVRRALRGVDLISTNDETIGPYLTRRFGIDAQRVRAFSWGVDLTVFRPALEDAAARWRARLRIPAGSPVVFSPRNFDPYWGSELIVGAMPGIVRAAPESVTVILRGLGGDDAAFAAARRRAEAEGWAGAARFIEAPLAPADMAALFNLAQVFISVPRTDLLAQTILEGMACGCLPVLADHPAYRKHLRPGANGLVIAEYHARALAAAVLEALRNAPLRAAARAEGPRRMAAQEDWRRNALQIEEVYRAAIARHALPTGSAGRAK